MLHNLKLSYYYLSLNLLYKAGVSISLAERLVYVITRQVLCHALYNARHTDHVRLCHELVDLLLGQGCPQHVGNLGH